MLNKEKTQPHGGEHSLEAGGDTWAVTGQVTQTFSSLIPGTKGLDGMEKARAVEPGRLGFQTFPSFTSCGAFGK